MRQICMVGAVALAGCAGPPAHGPEGHGPQVRTAAPGDPRPVARPAKPGAVAAAAAAAAQASADAGGQTGARTAGYLGTTVASLGLLDRPGMWLATPLVREERPGFVERVEGGARAEVLLVPNGRDAGAGSQISLAAMQALGLSPAALAPLKVHAR